MREDRLTEALRRLRTLTWTQGLPERDKLIHEQLADASIFLARIEAEDAKVDAQAAGGWHDAVIWTAGGETVAGTIDGVPMEGLPATPPGVAAPPRKEALYPCDECGAMLTEAQGGRSFTVCEACWDGAPPREEVGARNADPCICLCPWSICKRFDAEEGRRCRTCGHDYNCHIPLRPERAGTTPKGEP